MADLEEIDRKLNQIIRFFNIDGRGKLPVSIKQEAHERVIKLLERKNRRTKEKQL